MLSFRKKLLLSDFFLFSLFFFIIFFWIGDNISAFSLGALILLAYTFMTAIVVFRLSWPIQSIIDAITPYQEGKEEYPPRIILPGKQSAEYIKLAATLNSLTDKIRKQIETLKTQREATEGILESLGEGVIAVDVTGLITFANKVACEVLGIAKGRYFSDMPLHAKCHEMVLQALQTFEVIEETWEETSPKGTLYFQLFAAPLSGQHGAILVLQDKTADHKLVEMGKDFIANASHELRTPITILRGFAEMLQQTDKLSPAILNDIGEKIVRTSSRLDRLIKSLLALTDLESEATFYPCDLLAIATSCQHLILSAYPQAHISLENPKEIPPIAADGDLLHMAIMNLLENAVRYSSSPAQIAMSIGFTSEGVSLQVRDAGIGIPEADLPHIFNRFYTVDKARSRKSGGAGLGLSIVKAIVEKHRGKIAVVSELAKGSTFTLQFPEHTHFSAK